MPIDGGLRDRLEPGTKLVATYKGVEYRAEVVQDADARIRYRLTDGREFRSPSSAGKAVMSGISCNGWRFWSVDQASTATAPSELASAAETAVLGDAPQPRKRSSRKKAQ